MTQEWLKAVNDDPLPWLLEPDPQNPGVRYFALTDLLGKPLDDPEVVEARQADAQQCDASIHRHPTPKTPHG